MAKFLFDRSQFPDVTYADVYIPPSNDIEAAVRSVATPAEMRQINDLALDRERSRDIALRDPSAVNSTAATIALQKYHALYRELALRHGLGKGFSRDEVDLTPPRGGLSTTPVIVANMNTVTGKRMAEAIARVGGIAAIPQDKSDTEMTSIIEYMRTRHVIYQTPVSITMDTKVHEFRRYVQKRDVEDTAVVLGSDEELVGILSPSDLPMGINEDQPVAAFVRSGDIVTAEEGITPMQALDLMEERRIHFLPIRRDGKVVGILTKKHAAMLLRYRPNEDSEHGGLNMIVTVGALNRDPVGRVQYLVEHGVQNILLDTANFDQGIVTYHNLEKVRKISPHLNILVGNMVTRDAVRRAIGAGANGVKIGVGPGFVCTTRLMSGAGRPQVSAVADCAEEAHIYDVYAVADGGINPYRAPGDAAKAVIAGADYVMLGSPFAPVKESPPELQRDESGEFKGHQGMANRNSSVVRMHGRTDRTSLQKFRDVVGHRSEGVAIKIYQHPDFRTASDVHHAVCDGITAGAGYCDSLDMRALQDGPLGLQFPSGYHEGLGKSAM
ncbi:MAG: IMP dehydrogenase [Candidatus Peregrinibacteria bacterium Gr01-1014_25]|nr:MAG: IMP dehydrogenase [Candidatus Peregrinibacteria bacterium Gr01-1014_25]